MQMWQWVLLFSAVSLNTIVNCLRLYLEEKERRAWLPKNRKKEMKQNFDHSLEMLLHHEGGFVNHPKDPGGVTNLGVTKKVFEKWVGA